MFHAQGEGHINMHELRVYKESAGLKAVFIQVIHLNDHSFEQPL